MKTLVLCVSLICMIAIGSTTASAQCDRNTMSPINCGYYDEGYRDGADDARSNRSSDYRRHRNKYTSQYEDPFRRGYLAGYDSIRPTNRWTNSQRNSYDSGYSIGQNDRRNSQYKSGENAGRGYDQNIAAYFQQGYDDGYNNRPRRYDFPVGNYPTYPGGGGGGNTIGTAMWSGRVDDRANIIIRGNSIYAENISGNGVQTNNQNVNGSLPRRATTVTVRRTNGRGDVTVIQQPSRANNYTAIVQIYDRKSGADNYGIEVSWSGTGGGNVEEPYRSGSVRWRGRVDQTANIIIAGSDVQTQDAAGTGLSNVNFNINGYLARRPGSVTARKRNGRGTVTVTQQPTWDNDFTAIVQVFDPSGGADNYEVDINW